MLGLLGYSLKFIAYFLLSPTNKPTLSAYRRIYGYISTDIGRPVLEKGSFSLKQLCRFSQYCHFKMETDLSYRHKRITPYLKATSARNLNHLSNFHETIRESMSYVKIGAMAVVLYLMV